MRPIDISQHSPKALALQDKFANRIIGQEAATLALTNVLEKFLGKLCDKDRPIASLLFLGPTGTGKCLAKGTPILMFDGAIKPVEQIKVGDRLMGPDSQPRLVLSLAHGYDNMYAIVPRKGDSYIVNSDHVLSLALTPNGQENDHEIVNLSVKTYLSKSDWFKHRAKGYRVGVDFEWSDPRLDPYFLGLWLGDGTSSKPEITNEDVEIINYIYETASRRNMKVNVCDKNIFSITNGQNGGRKKNSIVNDLEAAGVFNNKHVPHLYKANSRAVRLSLLAGYIDTDGSLNDGGYDFISVNKQLADDICFIARSLGFACYIKKCTKSCQTGAVGTYYRGCVSGDISIIPCKVARKRAKSRRQKKNVLRTGIKVVPAGIGEYFGFEIDKDGLFLLGDFTVTHNTSTVEALCEGLFGSNKMMVRIDCGEFQHSHDIAKRIGSPPGYLGHKETPARLTQTALNSVQTQDMPVSIILFDEIEKASDALWHLLLSILDKGTVTLGDNSTTLFKDCIIIMTSNVGAINSDHGVLGFGKEDDNRDNQQIEDAAMSAARRKFTPEFLNRLDEIVCFKTLTTENIKEILGLEIRKAQSILFASNFSKLIPTPAALAELLKRGYDKRYNARSIRRTIEKEIMLPCARAISTNQLDTVEDIVIDYKDDEFKFYAVGA